MIVRTKGTAKGTDACGTRTCRRTGKVRMINSMDAVRMVNSMDAV